MELPIRMGLEAAGTVDAVGDHATKFKEGDRVGSLISLAGPAYYGAYAEYIVVPEWVVFPTPDSVSDQDAASIWMSYLTAWYGLVVAGNLKAGEAVVVAGASGSVATAAIQIAADLGNKVIGTTTSSHKVGQLSELPVQAIVDTSRESFVEGVRKATGGKGGDLFFDPIVGGVLPLEMEAAAPGARIIAYGLLNPASTQIDPMQLMRKRLRIAWSTVAALASLPAELSQAVTYIRAAFGRGVFRPIIARRFSLIDAAEAHRYVESNQQFGKIVMTV
jgi:NADPH:quinone reductase-like Zn-dependent oxidoreductase